MGSQRVRHDWATEINWTGYSSGLKKARCYPVSHKEGKLEYRSLKGGSELFGQGTKVSGYPDYGLEGEAHFIGPTNSLPLGVLAKGPFFPYLGILFSFSVLATQGPQRITTEWTSMLVIKGIKTWTRSIKSKDPGSIKHHKKSSLIISGHGAQ